MLSSKTSRFGIKTALKNLFATPDVSLDCGGILRGRARTRTAGKTGCSRDHQAAPSGARSQGRRVTENIEKGSRIN